MLNPYADLPSRDRWLLGGGTVLFAALSWSLLFTLGWAQGISWPAPWEVLEAFFQLLSYSEVRGERPLLVAMVCSSFRVLLGGVGTLVVSLPIGVLMGVSKPVNAALSPVYDTFPAVLISATLPVLAVGIADGEAAICYLLCGGMSFYMIPRVRDAISAVPPNYWASAKDMGATRGETLRWVVLPLALPSIADATIGAVGLMWGYTTIAEYANAERGLGELIYSARRFSEMDQVCVGITTMVVLSFSTYTLMRSIKRRLFPWVNE